MVSIWLLELRLLRFYAVSTNTSMRVHAYNELSKVVHPHAVDIIQEGKKIEATMPVGEGIGYVISFDIVGSTKIKHADFYQAVESFMAECHSIMMEGYKKFPLQSSAYRIKEMGDGFICSVGFPFSCPEGFAGADLALELSERFIHSFHNRMRYLSYHEPIRCGVGMAKGSLEGFFPHSGPKQYDLRGTAIARAKRYEAMRSVVYRLEGNADKSILFIQSKVFDDLSLSKRVGFRVWSALEAGRQIRDDGDATQAYYKFFAGCDSEIKKIA